MWVLNLRFLFKFSSRAQLHKKFVIETRLDDQTNYELHTNKYYLLRIALYKIIRKRRFINKIKIIKIT